MALSERVTRVRELAALLDFLPQPSRAEFADKLDGLGVRVDDTLALPDEEIQAIADQLYFLPVPGRKMMAYQLRARGVTVHSDEATLVLEREGPANLGKHAPQRVVKKQSVEEGMEALRAMQPELAAQIDAARANPEAAAKIDAAKSMADRDAIAKSLGITEFETKTIAQGLRVLSDQVENVNPKDLN